MKSEPSTALSPWQPRPASNSLPPLIAALLENDQTGRRRFHVPAHSGCSLIPPAWDLLRDPYRFDQTELDGLDVLGTPTGCLCEAQDRVAAMLGVRDSFFLVNGASVGLAAALLSVAGPGDTVLLPRNAHRSVLSGLILSGARPIWFLPDYLSEWGLWGAVSIEEAARQLEARPDAKALFLTSPTYEGLGSDIAAIGQMCRARGVALVVDEAHGGLWPFSDDLPVSACNLPCDAVIHSTHKCCGSLTQSALAHLPRDSRIDPAHFQQALNTLQTTSPSYLLLASLEATMHWLDSAEGHAHVGGWLARVRAARQELADRLAGLRLFAPGDGRFWDPTRLYLSHPSVSAEAWADVVERELGVACESLTPHGALYVAGLGLVEADFADLIRKLVLADRRFPLEEAEVARPVEIPRLPEMVMLPREAFFAPGQQVSPAQAVGRIAKETVVHCPPGIPVLLPGERIQPEHAPLLPESGVLVVR